MKNFKIWFEDQKFHITTLSNNYNNKSTLVLFKNSDGDVLYETNSVFEKDITVWYKLFISPKELKRITVEIYSNDVLIESKEIQENQLSIYVDKELGVGDFMWATPFIRKLSNIYNRKLDIYCYPKYNEFLKNNPYINNIYNRSEYYSDINNENFEIFYDHGTPYFYSDLRQLACKSAGMTLKDDECDLDYIPDEYIEIENLPDNYVVINPRIDHKERTFKNVEDWQKLVNSINELGFSVVAIGVGPSEHYDKLNIKNGLNMIYDDRQNSLSQTWHIINNSQCFITFDTGIYVFAGTTDTNILLNGWTCDPWYHQPIRNGSRDYKFFTVRGDCPIYCTSDPKSNVDQFGTINIMHKSNECILNTNYACTPTVEMVVDKLSKILKLK